MPLVEPLRQNVRDRELSGRGGWHRAQHPQDARRKKGRAVRRRPC